LPNNLFQSYLGLSKASFERMQNLRSEYRAQVEPKSTRVAVFRGKSGALVELFEGNLIKGIDNESYGHGDRWLMQHALDQIQGRLPAIEARPENENDRYGSVSELTFMQLAYSA
jgi:hypothetical protein